MRSTLFLWIALATASPCLADKLPTPNSCTANVTGQGQITFSWIPVAGGVSYDISRDGVLLGTFSSTTLPTQWVDSPPARQAREILVCHLRAARSSLSLTTGGA